MKCCQYHSGMLKEPVQFERKTRTSNGAGGFTEAWTPLAGSAAWAMVKAVSGGERYASERVEATATHKVVVRYFDGLKEADRVVIRGRAHNIRFVNNVEFKDEFLEITTQQGVAV